MGQSKQLILVFECNKNSRTDYNYVYTIINYYFEVGGNKISPIFAGNKSKLYHDKTKQKIENLKRQYNGDTEIIIFADFDSSSNHDNNKLIRFCNGNKYDLIWSNREIEEVVFGKKIKGNKVEAANNFIRNHQVGKINTNKFSNEQPTKERFTSNMFLIFDEYLQRKSNN